MSVPESKRGENKLEVFVKAQELTVHTLTLTSNRNKFKARHMGFINRIDEAAIDASRCFWKANGIYVNDADDAKRRRKLQEKGINAIDELQFLIQIAAKLFHLKGKSVRYWSDLARSVRDMAVKWKESDSRRFAGF